MKSLNMRIGKKLADEIEKTKQSYNTKSLVDASDLIAEQIKEFKKRFKR